MMRATLRMGLVTLLAITAAGVAAQTSATPTLGPRPEMPRQSSPQAPTAIPADMAKSLEAQRPAWEAYQSCIRENEQAFKLSSLTRSLVEMRNGKERMLALLKDPAAAARTRGKSYDDLVAEAMAEYRKLGGAAGSIDDVVATPNPCLHVQPGPRPPPERMRPQGGAPVSSSKSLSLPAN